MDTISETSHEYSFETPWAWNVPVNDHPIDQFLKIETEKMVNTNEEKEFKWMKYLLNLVLGYEHWDKKRDAVKSLEHIGFCENHIEQLTRDGCKEQLFVSMRPALWHVTLATKLQVLQESESALTAEEKQNIVRGIMPVNEMTETQRAGIAGIKAGVYLQCGKVGHHLALQAARQASELDPTQAEWWFLVGNILGRRRRIENRKEIGVEELQAIEKAITLEEDASYIVILAQLYAEFSCQLFYSKSDRDYIKKSKKYAKKAVQTFETAIQLRPNCASMMARVAHGLMRIKCDEVIDSDYIRHLLLTLVETTPNNSMAVHDLGMYYVKFEKNFPEALKSLNRSNELGNEKALLSLIALKWKMDKQAEIIADLESGLLKYLDHENQAELYAQLGSCFLLVESDWENAVKCFIKCLQLDPSAKYLLGFGGFTGKKVDLLYIVTTEILLNTPRTDHLSSETKQMFLDISRCISPDTFTHYQNKRHLFSRWERDQVKAKNINQSRNRF